MTTMPEPMSDERLAELEGVMRDGVCLDPEEARELMAEVRRLREERADVVAARLLEATEMKAIILQRALNLIGADDASPS